MDFSDHSKVLEMLQSSKDADNDNRNMAREECAFVDDPQGQWEPTVYRNMAGRPRYTYDLCSPIVDQVHGMITQADFDIRVKPAGSGASKESAQILDGIIRMVERMSNASNIYSSASRDMLTGGISGWRVEADWASSNSFNQDLLVRPITNFKDRVWFEPGCEMQNADDASYCFIESQITTERFEEMYPDAKKGGSLEDNYHQHDRNYTNSSTVIEVLYKKKYGRELVLMSDGSVYEVDDKFESVADDLKVKGVTEVRRRKSEGVKVYSRKLSTAEFLTEEEETPFESLPVIPLYGNFGIVGASLKYKGIIRNLMDAQRTYNYARSREVEEGALAPRAKFWMTPAQKAGHERSLSTLNVNSDPVQLYNPDPLAPGKPEQSGGAQINAGLAKMAQDASDSINRIAGVFSSNMGDNPNLQSGVAIGLQQSKGDNSTVKYFKSLEIAIQQTAKVIVEASKRVYDTKRTLTIADKSGADREVTVNDTIYDEESGKMVELNDLSVGFYDTHVSAEPSFKTRQTETVRAITDLARLNPEILNVGADLMLSNISAPGMDVLAERVRGSMVNNGQIPESQLTEEETEMVERIRQAQAEQQALAAQQVDPAQKIAEAELDKARAQVADTISKTQEREAKLQIQLQESQNKLEQQRFENELALANAQIAELSSQIKSLKDLKDATGAEAIIAPNIIGQQVGIVSETQAEIGSTTDIDKEAELAADELLAGL